MTPSGALAPVIDAGAWDARAIPQSYGLLFTLFIVIRLSEVGPVSSLSRMPPALFATTFPETVTLLEPVRWMASPQSKLDPVSNAGIPGQDGPDGPDGIRARSFP